MTDVHELGRKLGHRRRHVVRHGAVWTGRRRSGVHTRVIAVHARRWRSPVLHVWVDVAIGRVLLLLLLLRWHLDVGL